MEGQFVLETNGLLFTDTNIGKRNVNQLFVPKNLKNEILEWCHDHIASGHLGIMKTYKRIRPFYYWHNMFAAMKR